MSNPSDSDEEVAPSAEVEVNNMETITASVEEVTLSENTQKNNVSQRHVNV